MTDRKPHTVNVASGKYTLINHGSDIEMLRYGQPWHRQSEAGNAIASLMYELDAARVVLQAVRGTDKWLGDGRSHARILSALEHHDRLTDDRDPPSEWCGAPATTAEPAPFVSHADCKSAEDCARRFPPRQAGADQTLGMHDAVYEAISDTLSREDRWSVQRHRDTCELITKRVLAAIAPLIKQS